MRAVLKLEQFDNVGYAKYMGRDKSNCWVARLLGLSDKWGFKREFINGPTDWRAAKTTGSRGAYRYYALADGLYEVNERKSWKHVRRYFIRVQDETITEIDREEILQCLINDTSE